MYQLALHKFSMFLKPRTLYFIDFFAPSDETRKKEKLKVSKMKQKKGELKRDRELRERGWGEKKKKNRKQRNVEDEGVGERNEKTKTGEETSEE